MANICHIIPRIRNTEGEYVESSLFKQLLGLTEDRAKTKRMYEEMHSDEFLEWFGDWLTSPENVKNKLDENGEPKYEDILNYQFRDYKQTEGISKKEKEYQKLLTKTYTSFDDIEKALKKIPGFTKIKSEDKVWVKKDEYGSNNYGDAVVNSNKINRVNPGLLQIRIDANATRKAGRTVYYPFINKEVLSKQENQMIDKTLEANEHVPLAKKASKNTKRANEFAVRSLLDDIKDENQDVKDGGNVVARVMSEISRQTSDPVLRELASLMSRKTNEDQKELRFQIVSSKEELKKESFGEHDVMQVPPPTALNFGVIQINEALAVEQTFDFIIRAFMHEVVHLYTVSAIFSPKTEADKAFVKKIKSLYSASLASSKNVNEFYGFTNVREFVSEIMTNPAFIEEVKSLKFNVWQRFWYAVLDFLGIQHPTQEDFQNVTDIVDSYLRDYSTLRKLSNKKNTIIKPLPIEGEKVTDEDFAQDQDLKSFFEKGREISKLEELNRKAIKTIVQKLKALKRSGKTKETLNRQQRTINRVYNSLTKLRGAVTFVKESSNLIGVEYEAFRKNEQRALEGKFKFTIRNLARMREAIEAFDLLEEYREMFHLEKGLVPTKANWKAFYETLDNAIAQKNIMKAAYEYRGMDLLIDFLEPHFNGLYKTFERDAENQYNKLSKAEQAEISMEDYIKREAKGNYSTIKERTKTLLRFELKKASKDINVLTRHLDNMLDTRDVIASAMIEKITITDYEARKGSIEVSTLINEVLQKLEKSFPQGPLTDLRKSYDFMLEKKDGEYTQHYITPSLSSFQQTWFDLLEETKNLEEEERDAIRQEWKDQNAPLDKEAFINAKNEFVQSLVDSGDMTDEEADTYSVAESIYLKRGKIREVLVDLQNNNRLNPNAAELISSWVLENTWDYRDPARIWRNPQWEHLVSLAGGDLELSIPLQREQVKENVTKDPRISFYNLIVRLSEEANRNVSFNFRIGSRLPGMEKDISERIKEGQSRSEIFNASLAREFTLRQDETERGNKEITDAEGNPKYFLPVHFTSQVKLENQSWDIPTLYNEFWKMANDHALKNEILPEMEMTKFFIDQRGAVGERDRSGKAKKRFYGPIKDFINKPKGKTLIGDQFNDWMLMNVYGKAEKDEGSFKIRKGKLSDKEKQERAELLDKPNLTTEEKSRLKKLSRKGVDVEMDWAKLSDFVNKYTALNLLGLNFTQGTANVILGETLQLAEAIAGEYINLKSYNKANKVYFQHLPNMLADIGARRPKNVMSLLIERFNVLHEYDSISFRKSTRFRQLMTSNTLFFMQEAGEHFMQSRFLLAFLDDKRALDKNGNDIGSMLDNYVVVDGRLKLKDNVDIEKSEWDSEQQELFGIKVRGVLSRLHGEYSDLGRVAIQRMALGRMAYMFRKFVVPGFKRRWQKSGYTQRLDDVVEGSYLSFGRFFGKFVKDVYTFQFHLISEDWRMLTKHEKANIHRTIVELNFLLVAIILGNVALTMRGESDDDKEDQWWSFAAYQMLRLRAELLFFTPKLDESMSILRSPMASMSVLENSVKLIGQLFDPISSGTFQFSRYEQGAWKGKPKIQRTLIQMTPGMKQMYRMRDISNQTSWFMN